MSALVDAGRGTDARRRGNPVTLPIQRAGCAWTRRVDSAVLPLVMDPSHHSIPLVPYLLHSALDSPFLALGNISYVRPERRNHEVTVLWVAC